MRRLLVAGTLAVGALLLVVDLVPARSIGDNPTPATLESAVDLDPPYYTTRFSPPPPDAQPRVTAEEALAAFQVHAPDLVLPPDATVQLGLYTSDPGDGSGFHEVLSWGYRWHECAVPRHEVGPETHLSCTLWLFLNANTGEMLEAVHEQ